MQVVGIPDYIKRHRCAKPKASVTPAEQSWTSLAAKHMVGILRNMFWARNRNQRLEFCFLIRLGLTLQAS